jgi:autotransporter translocation and assembly factor TamB
MKIARVIGFTLLMALFAGLALAGDVTGKWVGQIGDGDNAMTVTFNFKQDGTTLTGTAQGPQGDPMEIKDGKVDGDKISFLVSVDAGGTEMKITHEGTVKDNEITLNIKTEGGGDMGPHGTVTLKRQE